ncbi:MAG: 16S rRNA (guanine(527)-N(7))-methyltransferase RsmG [Bacteroidales bacterium]|nr:16S rRNA (guanine(527)-N(7))-methyltransferase RsmG [Bacteroidales bacterium]
MTDLIIGELKEKYGESTANKLLSYLDMVLERNEHINLTAVRDRDEAIVKHVLDSLAICDLPEYKSAKTIIDVGTGAGFPGALLAIVSPEKDFTLLDSTLKRLRVIDEFADTLGISNLKTVHARAEEINRKPEYSGAFDLCVSRAVADLDTLSKWCLPFVRKGGNFIAYKGENYAEELERAGKTLRKLGSKIDHIEAYPGEPEEISGHVLLVISR